MFYIESPTLAPDMTWALRFDTFWAVQKGKNAYGNFYNMKIRYLSVNGSDWVTTYTDANAGLILPNGFKGYIKCYMNDCSQDAAGNQTTYQYLANDRGFDMSRSFSVNTIGFLFGWLGGEYGDLVMGGVYSVTADGDTLYADITDKNGLGETRCNLVKLPAAMGDLNGDGSFDAADLSELRRYLLGCASSIDTQAADVNGDAQVDIRDLVALKKVMAETDGTA